MEQSRRAFLKRAAGGVVTAAVAGPVLLAGEEVPPEYHPAMHWRKLEGNRVECTLCPRVCRVADLERGFCGVRENRSGTYYTLVYDRICSCNVDPIEKKPLFHHLPKSLALSIATAGCNMACKFCQNWNISQFRPEQVHHVPVTAQKLVDAAKQSGCASIAYTYNEPVVFYEQMHDSAVVARKNGLGAVAISNGYIRPEPLKQLAPHMTAYKVDLKAFTDEFYRKTCRGTLKPVLDTLVLIKSLDLWTEIVVLIVPTLNDKPEETQQMTAWIKKELGPDVPVHFTRFQPTYLMKNLPPTPVSTLERCRKIALDAGINYVYLGNVTPHEAEHTYCPTCRTVLVERVGFLVRRNVLKAGACPKCGRKIPGVWALPAKP